MARPIDRQKVDQLVIENLPAALRLAQRLTHDPDEAEDVVQEALCRVLDRWRGYRGDASFRTWLLQIVINVNRDWRRRRRPTESMLQEAIACTATDPHDQAAADELSERIQMAIRELPDRQREVALLCLGECMRAVEVATILQVTEANVHTCLHLARKKIAAAIGVNCVPRE